MTPFPTGYCLLRSTELNMDTYIIVIKQAYECAAVGTPPTFLSLFCYLLGKQRYETSIDKARL